MHNFKIGQKVKIKPKEHWPRVEDYYLPHLYISYRLKDTVGVVEDLPGEFLVTVRSLTNIPIDIFHYTQLEEL